MRIEVNRHYDVAFVLYACFLLDLDYIYWARLCATNGTVSREREGVC
jgi:hypothetical protein